MPQTTIAELARGFAGLTLGTPPKISISGFAESIGISQGQPVLFGTADRQALPITNGDTVDGSTVAGFVEHVDTRPSDSGVASIAVGDELSIVRVGIMYLEVTESVTAGAQVTVGVTTAALGNVGVTDDADNDPVPGVRFLESGNSGDLVLAMINLA